MEVNGDLEVLGVAVAEGTPSCEPDDARPRSVRTSSPPWRVSSERTRAPTFRQHGRSPAADPNETGLMSGGAYEVGSASTNSNEQVRTGGSRRRPGFSLPPGVSEEIRKRISDVVVHLEASAAMLAQGAQGGFNVPEAYRGLALQTARLAGFMTHVVRPDEAMPFSRLERLLGALPSTASQLLRSSNEVVGHSDGANATDAGTEPRKTCTRSAAALTPHVVHFKEAGCTVAKAIWQTPVSVLRNDRNRQFVKDHLGSWVDCSEKLHEQLKAQFGDTHPSTTAALEARSEASAAQFRTLARMAVANMGHKAYNASVGPVVAGIGRFFGAGN